jgi:hypothetical protein
MASASDIINALNGVTFGQGTLADTTSPRPSGGIGGYNPAGGLTDVASASVGSVDVAYVTQFLGGTVAAPNGSAGAVGYAVYDYTAATATNFATFGYLTLSNSATAGEKYYIHGFSNDALLLSKDATLTVSEVYGLTISGSGQDNFEILSNVDLGAGATSPAYGHYYTDTAGEGHYIFNYYGTIEVDDAAYNGNATPPTYPLVFTSNPSVYDVSTIPCFAEGAHVLTVRGAVAVEALEVGDEVLTAAGATRPVIWIGSRRIKVSTHPVPAEVNPVRIRAHAFGEGQPSRDLRLSPGHAVHMDGVLVPVGHLVNGATIVQEEVDSVRYFHVELDAHDVLLAEGLACESYLDDGNRDAFANSPAHTSLYGRLDPVDWDGACAPVLKDRIADAARLGALQARLHARAAELGWVKTRDAQPALSVDGQALAPVHTAPVGADGLRLWFAVPVGAGEVVLTSRAARPIDLTPGALDTRRLGVAVAELRVDGEAVALTGETLGAGLHPLERAGANAWRWTDGAARLNLSGPCLVELTVSMAAQTWTRPAAAFLKLVKVS